MSTSAIMHHVEKMKATKVIGAEWLDIHDDKGNTFSIFMPINIATVIAGVWEAHQEGILIAKLLGEKA